jgi:hypothetical protein
MAVTTKRPSLRLAREGGRAVKRTAHPTHPPTDDQAIGELIERSCEIRDRLPVRSELRVELPLLAARLEQRTALGQ